jgi:hypothetical protein
MSQAAQVNQQVVDLENPADARAEVARLKRCLATSQDELVEATNAKRKKPP